MTADRTYRCVNGHDCCAQMSPGPQCPYCEPGPAPPDALTAEEEAALRQAARDTPSWGLTRTLFATLDAERNRAEHWHSAFQALEKAVVGETGASAIETAASLRARAEAAERERDGWKEAVLRHGICPTCALQAPEPYGCPDCLNTGWAQGAPLSTIFERNRAAALEGRAIAAETRLWAAKEVLRRVETFLRNDAARAAFALNGRLPSLETMLAFVQAALTTERKP